MGLKKELEDALYEIENPCERCDTTEEFTEKDCNYFKKEEDGNGYYYAAPDIKPIDGITGYRSVLVGAGK